MRVLGPLEDRVACDECFARLDEFVELELAGADAANQLPRLRAHLDGCRECCDQYETLRALLLSDAQTERR